MKEEEYVITKPQIKRNEDYVFVSKSSINNGQIKIKILYEGSDEAYSETLKDTKTLNRVFDFSKCLEGNYTILIKSEGRTFSNNIYIANAY